MGADSLCLICGCGFDVRITKTSKNGDKSITPAQYKWTHQKSYVNNKNELISLAGYTANGDYGEYSKGDKEVVAIKTQWHFEYPKTDYGIICHNDCLKLLETLGYKLKFSDVCRLVDPYTCQLKSRARYGKINVYNWQYFDSTEAHANDPWLLESPLTNDLNKARVLKLWSPLVPRLQKMVTRPSPAESATDFKVGKVLPGTDGNNYIVKKNSSGIVRWVLVGDNTSPNVSQQNGPKSRKQLATKDSLDGREKKPEKKPKEPKEKVEKKEKKPKKASK